MTEENNKGDPTTEVACPECGATMVLRSTTKHRYPNGEPRKLYGCPRFPLCRGSHGAHPDGRPVGVPATQETKDARRLAHAAFDAWWRGLGLSRDEGYDLLRDLMELPAEEAHIGRFSKEQCALLVRRIQEWQEEVHG